MTTDQGFERRLIRTCSVAGAGALLVYIAAIVPLLPDRIRWLCAFAMGPLLSLGVVGLGAYLYRERKLVATVAATLFGVLAGALVNVMLVVQASNQMYFQKFMGRAPDDAARASLRQMLAGVSTVQLGIDVSWDIFIGLATLLFGYALLHRRGLDRLLGTAGLVAGMVLLALNLWTFPEPPAEAGSIDVGPAVGLWYLVVSVRVLWATRAAPAMASS